MKSISRIIFFSLALFFSHILSAQLIFSATNWGVGTLNLQDTTWQLFGTPPPDVLQSFFTAIALTPDGSILGTGGKLSLSEMINESYLIKVNTENVLEGDTLFVLQNDQIGGLTSDKDGNVFMSGYGLHRYNLYTSEYEYMGSNPSLFLTQGMDWFDGNLYSSMHDIYHSEEEPPFYFFRYDTMTTSTSSALTFDFPVFTGISKVYDYETGQFRMIAAEAKYANNTAEKDSSIIYEVFVADTSYTRLFPLVLSTNSRRAIVGLASMDEFRTNFSLQLDLDADDSSGRFIDHFQTDGLCTRTFPLADTDTRIRAPEGGVDSLIVELITGVHPLGQETIHVDTLPNFTLQGNGSGRVLVIAHNPLELIAWDTLIAGIELHIAGDSLYAGERKVNFTLYSGSQVSDGAMAFVYPQPDVIPYVGQDYSVDVCPNRVLNLFAGLGTGVYRDGYWSPELEIINTTTENFALYNGYENDPGVYYYIVQEGSCGPDTAAVTVNEYPQILYNYGGFPGDKQELYICPGDTAVWEVDVQNAAHWNWNQGMPFDVSRVITGQTTYSMYQTDTNGCEYYFSTRFNTPTWEEEGPFTFRDTVYRCTGAILSFFNQTFSSDTTVCGVYDSTSDCDLTHCRTFRFYPNEETNDTYSICEGDAFVWHQQTFTEAGTYMQLLEGSGSNCDTLATLDLVVHPTYERNLVANLPPGGSFTVGDSVLTQAGLYHILLQSEFGCDSLINIRIETVSSVAQVNTVQCSIPTLLKKGQHAWQLQCSEPITVLSCEIFDAQGRQLISRTNHLNDGILLSSNDQHQLASGMYFYRLTMEAAGQKQVLTGRVLMH
ncbi:MAG: T9SS type A sorting domain-containing protein [Saprospiraceae bacterium]